MARVLWEYLRASFSRTVLLLAGILGVVLLLISLVAPTITRVAGFTLVILALVVGQFLAWRDMRADRDQQAAERDALKGQVERDAERLRHLQQDREIVGEVLAVNELLLADGKPLVRSRIFTDCTFLGPAAVSFPTGSVAMRDCMLGVSDSIEAMLIEVQPGRSYQGIVGFVNCEFVRCRFDRVAFLAPREILDVLRAEVPQV